MHTLTACEYFDWWRQQFWIKVDRPVPDSQREQEIVFLSIDVHQAGYIEAVHWAKAISDSCYCFWSKKNYLPFLMGWAELR